MPLRLFDSFLKRKIDFVPVTPGRVGIYVCGPTTQDQAHIGHARSCIAFDVIARYLRWVGFEVKLVRNVTDIDDKIIRRAAERGVPPLELSASYAEAYNRDMAACGCRPPDEEPRVTAHIADIIDLTRRLVESGKAYPAAGDVYYAVDAFPAYGQLSGQSIDELQAGARIEPGEQKKNPMDFALWKAAKPGEPSWESPWGPGRPGWHIECSAMVLRHLGETYDIHGGGRDLIFPHHENEIAQSQGLTGPGTFARFWLHNGLLNFSGEKMSKSLGNVFSVAELLQRYDGEGIRFFMLQHHYRAPLNFDVQTDPLTFPGLDEAERRMEYFHATLARIEDFLGERREVDAGPVVPEAEGLQGRVNAAMEDDLNTSVAVAELGEAAKAANKLLDDAKSAPKDVRRRSLARLARDLVDIGRGAFGLFETPAREFLRARRGRLCKSRQIDASAVEARLSDREAARKAKDFTQADGIRTELRALGIEIMDTPRGADWRVVD